MIQPHPSAPIGEVSRLSQYSKEHFVPPCAILCRNTAPLVAFAYELLHRNVPCRVVGKDLGWALCKIVDKLDTNMQIDQALLCWFERTRTERESKGQSMEQIEDQYKSIKAFLRNLGPTDGKVELRAAISAMFTDATSDGTKVLLLTIHRSKGLEWPTVFLLDFPKLLPSKYATQQWQLTQERNLSYVAITRSMDKLYYINSDNWKVQNG